MNREMVRAGGSDTGESDCDDVRRCSDFSRDVLQDHGTLHRPSYPRDVSNAMNRTSDCIDTEYESIRRSPNAVMSNESQVTTPYSDGIRPERDNVSLPTTRGVVAGSFMNVCTAPSFQPAMTSMTNIAPPPLQYVGTPRTTISSRVNNSNITGDVMRTDPLKYPVFRDETQRRAPFSTLNLKTVMSADVDNHAHLRARDVQETREARTPRRARLPCDVWVQGRSANQPVMTRGVDHARAMNGNGHGPRDAQTPNNDGLSRDCYNYEQRGREDEHYRDVPLAYTGQREDSRFRPEHHRAEESVWDRADGYSRGEHVAVYQEAPVVDPRYIRRGTGSYNNDQNAMSDMPVDMSRRRQDRRHPPSTTHRNEGLPRSWKESMSDEIRQIRKEMGKTHKIRKRRNKRSVTMRSSSSSSCSDRGKDSDSEPDTIRLCRRNSRPLDSVGRGPRLPNCTGTESWSVWLSRFKEVAMRRGWSKDDMLDEMLPKLQGAAGDFVFGRLPQACFGTTKN
jgi:hypothetical protein